MELKEIADGLAAKFGIEGLAVEDGEAALEIDGMPVLLSEGEGAAIVMTDFVGEPPAEAEGRFGEVMLQANFLFRGTEGATLAQNPETRAFAIVRALELPGLDPDAFSEAVERFVNQLERWKRLLADFRPAMLQTAKQEEPGDPGIAMQFEQNFLKV